ncbi:DUF6734 family protein [Desertimonas flava]|uniref:DUF6734 family protein n=1 Tax=Desertimonas flava TaxID=2064846 RepID=UPI0013C50C93|nr:DUF6734 family protein [Desertimonas flava]
MRAVWSFWPAPFALARANAWGTERNHLLAWVLSFECARRHHETTALVTDAVGAELLVDGLGLEFDDVSLSLDRLGAADRSWWTVGKLVAIAEQSEPFVHLDPDVFLWNALPDRLTGAAVFAQNPEAYEPGSTYYKPELIETALTATGGWLPPEWDWYRRPGVVPRGECCGIVGGNDVRLLRHYAETGLRLIGDPGNAAGLAALPERQALTITLEQYLLAACVEHHRTPISYLFPTWAAAGDEPTAIEAGFTHLIADTKREPGVVARLEQRVRREFPGRYERCVALAGSPGTASRQAPVLAAGA